MSKATLTAADAAAKHARNAEPAPDRQQRWQSIRPALRELWDSFNSAPLGRRVPGTLPVAVLAAAIVGVVALFTTSTGWAFAYADAQSHLTIARRIFDSLMPGFTQLGTVWLPLPNILLIPFTASLTLWASGWAAALLGMICMAGTVGSVYRIGARIGLGRTGRLIAPVLLMTNPSLLYVSTTGLSEPVLIMFLAATAAGLTSWATVKRPMSAGEVMVFCGLPAAGAVLSRYEGWALLASGALFMVIVGYRKNAGRDRRNRLRATAKSLFAFLMWPIIGVSWWLAYNFVVYQDPLEFLRGQYSASALQAPVSESGLLAYKGEIGLTLWSYHWAVIGTAGLLTLVLGGVGLVLATIRFGLTDRSLCVWLLATGWAFSLLSLYLGQTHMNNMHTLPQGWWNNRYALVTLLWLSVLIGVLVDTLQEYARALGTRLSSHPRLAGWSSIALRGVSLTVLIGLVVQAGILAGSPVRYSAVLSEAKQYMDIKAMNGTDAAAEYLGKNYDGGRILMDESAAGNAILPQIGLPLREYLNRSTGELFETALADPAANAKWVFYTVADAPALASASVADLVYARLLEDPKIAASYETVFAEGDFVIAKRISS